MLPGLDGLALLRALRADHRTEDLPIIVLTAQADEAIGVGGPRGRRRRLRGEAVHGPRAGRASRGQHRGRSTSPRRRAHPCRGRVCAREPRPADAPADGHRIARGGLEPRRDRACDRERGSSRARRTGGRGRHRDGSRRPRGGCEPWLPGDTARELPDLDANAPAALAEAFRTGRSIFVGDAAAVSDRYTDHGPHATEAFEALIAAPLKAGARLRGAVGFSFEAPARLHAAGREVRRPARPAMRPGARPGGAHARTTRRSSSASSESCVRLRPGRWPPPMPRDDGSSVTSTTAHSRGSWP